MGNNFGAILTCNYGYSEVYCIKQWQCDIPLFFLFCHIPFPECNSCAATTMIFVPPLSFKKIGDLGLFYASWTMSVLFLDDITIWMAQAFVLIIFEFLSDKLLPPSSLLYVNTVIVSSHFCDGLTLLSTFRIWFNCILPFLELP